MNLCIVGHGPSMLQQKIGDFIDSHDCVVRLKRCQEFLKMPEHFGKRTDVIAGSFTIAPEILGIGGAKEHWVLMDSRHQKFGDDPVILEQARRYFDREGCSAVIDPWLSWMWDKRYRELRDLIGGSGHDHTSQGTKALVYAMAYKMPNEVRLVGFDNVRTGCMTWSLTRGPDWTKYPDHRWDAEHKLIHQIRNYYGTNVVYV